MLATILKSTQAVQITIAIIETFAKIRRLSRNLKELTTVKDEADQKALMQKNGEIISEVLNEDFETTDTETTIEINFAMLTLNDTSFISFKSILCWFVLELKRPDLIFWG